MGHSEQEQIRESIRHLLEGSRGPAILTALLDTGWFELWDEDQADALQPLFSLQGELLVEQSPMLHVVMARALTPETTATEQFRFAPVIATRAADSGRIHGVTIGDPADLPPLVTDLAGTGIVRLSDLSSRPIGGLDPSLGLFTVDAELDGHDVLVQPPVSEVLWAEAAALGRAALAEELVGAATAVLSTCVEYARDRRQFGRPIGSFQAIQHKLAEAHVMLTAARTACEDAWIHRDPLSADLAKSWAGRAARLVVRHGQQTLGGIGFTWEHPFHRYARRIHVLDALLGEPVTLEAALGAQVLAEGAVRRMAVL
jgi:hypothetical protein